MNKVFISYSREDLEIARHLAQQLGERGFEVWWDTELVGSDDFYEVILGALSSAKAAIVIWSKHSVQSRFVRDEARFALFHNKLVAVKTDDLDMMTVPFGFQSQHTDSVCDYVKIEAALQKLGVVPAAPGGGPVSEGSLPGKADIKQLNASRLQAFGQGLLLRLPEFQFERQRFFTSLGVITSLAVVCFAILAAAVGAIGMLSLKPSNGAGVILAVGLGAPLFLMVS